MNHQQDKNLNKTFGCYTVIGVDKPQIKLSGQRKKMYICQCQCGNIRSVDAYKVTHCNYQHCNQCKHKLFPTKTNMIGKTFHHLTVIERAPNKIQPNGSHKIMYQCRCDCGNIITVSSSHLKSGHTTSCGCAKLKIMQQLLVKDLTGQQFGKLTVVEKGPIKNHRQHWICKCECGNKVLVSSRLLLLHQKQSCGCLSSAAEHQFAQYLIKNNYKFQQQYTFEECKDKRKLPFDFAIFNNESLMMLVELNGEQHYAPFTYCGENKEIKQKNFQDRIKKDKIKVAYCEENNIPLLIIKYSDFKRMEELFDNFYSTLLMKG